MTIHQAEEYTDALGQVVSGSLRKIALGESLGVHKALGLTMQGWLFLLAHSHPRRGDVREWLPHTLRLLADALEQDVAAVTR
jgi:hypothetical protein